MSDETVSITRLAVYATEEEQSSVRCRINSGGDVARLINELAAAHGLPEIPSGYGILMPPGEFVKPAEETEGT